MATGPSYRATAQCDAPADAEERGDGVFAGRVLRTGQEVFVGPLSDRNGGTIVFEVGVEPRGAGTVHPGHRTASEEPGTAVVILDSRQDSEG